MVHAVSLGLVLMGTWLLLSGIYKPLILIFGVLSCVVVVAITLRMDVVDREGHPVHLSLRALTFIPWLILEIAKANVDVVKRVLRPTPDISPTMVRLKATQKTAVGLVTYANAITLTPGTVAVDVEPGEILVHALSKEGAEGLATGYMDERVTRLEGGARD